MPHWPDDQSSRLRTISGGLFGWIGLDLAAEIQHHTIRRTPAAAALPSVIEARRLATRTPFGMVNTPRIARRRELSELIRTARATLAELEERK
jgi:hypothetical protein